MAYDPSIPTSGQSLAFTRDKIRTNFDLIQNQAASLGFAFNHVALGNLGAGKHKFIQMPVSASIPANPNPPGGLVSGDANIYSKTSTTESNLFFSPDNSGKEYQLTRAYNSKFAQFSTNGNSQPNDPPNTGYDYVGGFTFLPGGLLLQYGTAISNRGTLQIKPRSGTILFPAAYTTTPYQVVINLICKVGGTTSRNTVSTKYSTITSTQFQWNIDEETEAYVGFSWFAIGI